MIDSDAYCIYIQRDTLLDSLCYSIEIDDEVLDALDNRFLCPDGIAQPDVWVYEFKGTHLSIVQDICVVIEDVYDRFKCGGRPFRLHTCPFINAAVSTAIGEVHAEAVLKAEARRAARAKRTATITMATTSLKSKAFGCKVAAAVRLSFFTVNNVSLRDSQFVDRVVEFFWHWLFGL